MGTLIFLVFCGIMIAGVFVFMYVRSKKVKKSGGAEPDTTAVVSKRN